MGAESRNSADFAIGLWRGEVEERGGTLLDGFVFGEGSEFVDGEALAAGFGDVVLAGGFVVVHPLGGTYVYRSVTVGEYTD